MNKRPIYLNLVQIRLPVTGFVSILHRISGLVLFLLIPFMLYIFEQSLQSEASFAALGASMSHFGVKALVWVLLMGLFYHAVAGCKHLLMDMHLGDSKDSARRGAWIVLVVTLIAGLGLAWKMWGGL